MQKWIQPPICLDHGLHVPKLWTIPPNRAPKMRERHQLFFGLRLVSKEFQHPAIQTKILQHFGGLFSSNKSAPANSKTGFYANRDQNHPHVDPIWLNGTFKLLSCDYRNSCHWNSFVHEIVNNSVIHECSTAKRQFSSKVDLISP